jgi:predicted nuclease with TOPRIM domain
LEAAIKARNLSNTRPSASDRKAAYASLMEKYRKLEQMKLSEYAKTAFEQNMADRLASQSYSQVSLFQKNNRLREDNARLEEHAERLQGKLVEAYEEISRLKDQLRTKSQLKVAD